MSPVDVFISHSSKDDDFVKKLREAFESHGISVWVDSRNLRGGSKLAPEIDEAIEQARQVIVVLSPNTVNSPWVRKEIDKAVEVEKQRRDEGYRVIPLLLPGIEPSALPLWFAEEPVGVRVEIKTGGLSEAMPAILAALGERLPTDREPSKTVAPQRVEELILKLSDPKIVAFDGKRRATATATLIYESTSESNREVESKRFTFTAPLGVIEAEDMRWYLEEFYLWPIGVFKERAARIETLLPKWGEDLYRAALAPQIAQEALNAWQQVNVEAERRFSVFVDSELPDGASDTDQAVAREAASELLSLPWELLHDGRGFLFHGKHPVRVRRRLPNRHSQPHRPTGLPIRILLVSPRPEEENRIAYIDHRISAKPLVEAAESLGELAKVTMLVPPTFPALEEALQKADDAGEPFDVIHFDGHGIYDKEHGLGALCFEDPNEAEKLEKRAMQLIHAEKLAEVIRDHRIPLVFLEACQTAKTEEDPTASVAAKLLEEGVTSIVAMSHSVLVETAHRFVKAFYQELAQGKRIGAAMIAGQRELHRDTNRGKVMGAGELNLQDWFVPVLYQEQQDPQLINQLPPKEVQQLQAQQRRLSLGELPELTTHEFQGRSRELLALERLLHRERYAVVRGQGGAGKTTLAVELARWLVRTNRARRAAFVSLEQYTDARTVLDSIGRQLLPNYSVAHYGDDLKQALQPVERVLADRATIIVLDNIETVLPNAGEDSETIKELFNLCRKLLDADPATRIVFTSREALPAPFQREITLGALTRTDAIALVSDVMKQEGLTPKAEDPGGDPQEIVDLVEAVNCHARALVLLAREVSRKGVRATTENLYQLMAKLDRKHPGDRENSLYASVELSLRRLPKEVREQIKALAVFHSGANLKVLMCMQGLDEATVQNIASQLIEVGLAEDMGYDHLRLDPALPPYLLREMSAKEQEEAQARWADAMRQLSVILYEERFKDTDLAARLIFLESPNFMAILNYIQDKLSPEDVINWANRIEGLFANMSIPQALKKASRLREQVARGLGGWSHDLFVAESRNIDRMMERGELQAAYEAVQQLLQRSLTTGEEAYPEAKYDIAMAFCNAGEVQRMSQKCEEALQYLTEAHRRFQAIVTEGTAEAEHMVSVALRESGICFAELGRLDEAANAFEEAYRQAEQQDAIRDIAISKSHLGNVRRMQGRYREALELIDEARKVFERLGEPKSVAHTWHQIGALHQNTAQFEQAERAYRHALAIRVQQNDIVYEADILYALGGLYQDMERLEESITFYRQAVDIDIKLRNLYNEGRTRNAMAASLIKLRLYNEARYELLRAIECKKPYDHAAQLWQTWHTLQRLEQATGNAQAAAQARQQAIESYMAYRRAGGQNQTPGAQLCDAVTYAITQSKTTELKQLLNPYLGADAEPWAKMMIPKAQAILQGDRSPTLADDPNLDYGDAVELKLLLEKFNTQ